MKNQKNCAKGCPVVQSFKEEDLTEGGTAMNEEDITAAGIDYDGALMRFVQKREIYEKYLRKFLDDTHEAEALQAYRAQKLDEMQERVHALKGVSGTLGTGTALSDHRGDREDLRTGNTQDLERKVARMQEENQKIREAIRGA